MNRVELHARGRVETTSAGRRRNVLKGEGMVVPVRTIDLKVDGAHAGLPVTGKSGGKT